MPITQTIVCDRCDTQTSAGFTVAVKRVALGGFGDVLDVTEFGDKPRYALCAPCGELARDYMNGRG